MLKKIIFNNAYSFQQCEINVYKVTAHSAIIKQFLLNKFNHVDNVLNLMLINQKI